MSDKNLTTETTVTEIANVEQFDVKLFKENKIIGSDITLTKAALKADSESYSLESAMSTSFAFVEQIKDLNKAEKALKNSSTHIKEQKAKVKALTFGQFTEKSELIDVLKFFGLSDWSEFLIEESEKKKTVRGETVYYTVYALKKFDLSECKPILQWVKSLDTYSAKKTLTESLTDYGYFLTELNAFKGVASSMMKATTYKSSTVLIKEQRKLL